MVAPSVLPGRAFKRIDRVSRLLFHWTARDLSLAARTGQVPTFTRPSSGAMVDRDGIGRVAVHSQPRFEMVDLDGNGRQTPGLVLEGGLTQLVTDPENFGAWTAVGTPVLTGGQADPFGGTAAYTLADDNAAAAEEIQEVVTFTANATKSKALFVKKHTPPATHAYIALQGDGGVFRGLWQLTWDANNAPVLVKEQGGSASALLSAEPWGNGWYRLNLAVGDVVAAETNTFRIMPTNVNNVSETGTLYIFGANAWNAPFPGSYQGPSGGATVRVPDAFTALFNCEPLDALTVLARFARAAWAGLNAGVNPAIWSLGAGGANYIRQFWGSSALAFRTEITSASTVEVQTPFPAGNLVELCSQFANLPTAGTVRVDAGSGFGSPSSPAPALAAFGAQLVSLGSATIGINEMSGILFELKIAAGLYTRAQMLQLT